MINMFIYHFLYCIVIFIDLDKGSEGLVFYSKKNLKRIRDNIENTINENFQKCYVECQRAIRDLPQILSANGISGGMAETEATIKFIDIYHSYFAKNLELCITKMNELYCSDSLTDYFKVIFGNFASSASSSIMKYLCEDLKFNLTESNRISISLVSGNLLAKVKLLEINREEQKWKARKSKSQYILIVVTSIATIIGAVIGLFTLFK